MIIIPVELEVSTISISAYTENKKFIFKLYC